MSGEKKGKRKRGGRDSAIQSEVSVLRPHLNTVTIIKIEKEIKGKKRNRESGSVWRTGIENMLLSMWILNTTALMENTTQTIGIAEIMKLGLQEEKQWLLSKLGKMLS